MAMNLRIRWDQLNLLGRLVKILKDSSKVLEANTDGSSSREEKRHKRTKSEGLPDNMTGNGRIDSDVEGEHYIVSGIDVTARLMKWRAQKVEKQKNLTDIWSLL
ncbi:hypothetical protein BGX31_006442, partial [Mortierella sp. GBA43]